MTSARSTRLPPLDTLKFSQMGSRVVWFLKRKEESESLCACVCGAFRSSRAANIKDTWITSLKSGVAKREHLWSTASISSGIFSTLYFSYYISFLNRFFLKVKYETSILIWEYSSGTQCGLKYKLPQLLCILGLRDINISLSVIYQSKWYLCQLEWLNVYIFRFKQRVGYKL